MTTEQLQTHTIDVFFGCHANGNRHTLVHSVFPKAFSNDYLPVSLAATPNLILLSGTRADMQARFVSSGRPVRRCGSGNLAVAAFVRKVLEPPSVVHQWRLMTPDAVIDMGYDAEGPYYRDRPLQQWPLQKPSLWRHILGASYLDGCYAGTSGDYVLLEVAEPLMRLKPHLQRLCLYSRRALIVIHRISRTSVQLRYFAPQYGSTEDAATGSACVQAAGYLRNRYGQREWLFEQQSPSGGVILARSRPSSCRCEVLVRGRAEVSTADCAEPLARPCEARLRRSAHCKEG